MLCAIESYKPVDAWQAGLVVALYTGLQWCDFQDVRSSMKTG